LIFEELEHAKKRGASIYAEVGGYGASSDAGHITQPHEDGRGGAAAMRHAMDDAGIHTDAIDYINAHGTSTPLGDVAETIAIKSVVGAHAKSLAVSSTKSSIGHLLGASGAVELVACVMAIRNNVAPPTINLETPGGGCDLDYVPNSPRDVKIDVAMSNSFGFGGHNACMVVKRFS
jgi:3-oxoacyl-[acyl-carrier-protein] synthase II